eukprot:gb/GECG01013004.1/.p1 GENE.gb/GECG01013004.1/~~gb/GECG01013004.1/.p1  ORF type:complete len:1008 (+),score=108.61 gb/GECG01013004.1/:1-3024(+)
MLFAATILSLVAFVSNPDDLLNLYLTVLLAFIIVLNSSIGYFQERHSGKVMQSVGKMMSRQCRVVREGGQMRTDVSNLVIGDLVMIQEGDRVPADLRIIHTNNVKVEASSITGESAPVQCTVKASNEVALHSSNLAFNTAECTQGSALGIVIRRGDESMIGIVARLASSEKSVETTLQKETKRFVRFISIMALTTALTLFIVGIARGFPLLETFVVTFVAILVANIPQGIPATVTTALTVAARRMQSVNVFVKRLDAVETLGAASVIGSDKTGTLTANQMSVQNFWVFGNYEILDGAISLDRSNVETREDHQMYSHAILRPSTKSSTTILEGQSSGETEHTASVQKFELSFGKLSRSLNHWYGHHMEPLFFVCAVCNEAAFSVAQKNEHNGNECSAHRRAKRASTESFSALDVATHTESKRLCATGASHILGNASDAALLRYCNRIAPVELVRERYPVVAEVPFSSQKKWAMKIVQAPEEEDPQGDHYYILLKGAPEIILEQCSTFLRYSTEHSIDECFMQEVSEAYERYAAQGERVIGCAMGIIKGNEVASPSELTNGGGLFGLTFLGLVSLMDPPRDGVSQAIQNCFKASIRVFMVTGDHAFTAEAIGRKVGIISLPTRKEVAEQRGVAVEEVTFADEDVGAAIVSGDDLHRLTDEGWDDILYCEQIVFARTTPTQKLEIVKRCQNRGEVVAATGDGVNDSPALKRADIGVAMGSQDASEVARNSADIVLADDNFASIVHACEEGRVLFDNLKKTVAYTLTHLFGEIMPVVLNLGFGFPLGLSPLQILSVELGTELLPAISLVYESAEDNIMERPPRNVQRDRLVDKPMLIYSYAIVGVLEGGVCFLSYLFAFMKNGVDLCDLPFSSDDHWSEEADTFVSGGKTFDVEQQENILYEARSAWYINLILCQAFHVWFARSRFVALKERCREMNTVTIAGVALEICLMIIFVYVPFMQPIFTTASIPFYLWLPSLMFATVLAFLSETCKYRAREGKEICGCLVKYYVF